MPELPATTWGACEGGDLLQGRARGGALRDDAHARGEPRDGAGAGPGQHLTGRDQPGHGPALHLQRAVRGALPGPLLHARGALPTLSSKPRSSLVMA